jgi:hypothetical protein
MVIQTMTPAAADILTAADLIPAAPAAAPSAVGHLDLLLRLADKGITLLGQGVELFDKIEKMRGKQQEPPAAAQQLISQSDQYAAYTSLPQPMTQPTQPPQQQAAPAAATPQLPDIDVLELAELMKLIDAKMPGITIDQFGGIMAYTLQHLQTLRAVIGGDTALVEIAGIVEANPGAASRVIKLATRRA